MKQKTKLTGFIISAVISVAGFTLLPYMRGMYQKGAINKEAGTMFVMVSMLAAMFAAISSVSFLIYMFVKDTGEKPAVKEPRISLKAASKLMIVLLVPYSMAYLFMFNNPRSQILDIIFGIIGFFYFYFLYCTAAHLYIAGTITKRPASVFWMAFFSCIIPLVHLIVPIWLIRKMKIGIGDGSQGKE